MARLPTDLILTGRADPLHGVEVASPGSPAITGIRPFPGRTLPQVELNRMIVEIRWPAALGRPATARLRDGFDATLLLWVERPVSTDGGPPVETPLPRVVIAVRLQDQRDDGGVHRVTTGLVGLPERTLGGKPILYTLEIALAEGVAWTGDAGPLRVEPAVQRFTWRSGGRLDYAVTA